MNEQNVSDTLQFSFVYNSLDIQAHYVVWISTRFFFFGYIWGEFTFEGRSIPTDWWILRHQWVNTAEFEGNLEF